LTILGLADAFADSVVTRFAVLALAFAHAGVVLAEQALAGLARSFANSGTVARVAACAQGLTLPCGGVAALTVGRLALALAFAVNTGFTVGARGFTSVGATGLTETGVTALVGALAPILVHAGATRVVAR